MGVLWGIPYLLIKVADRGFEPSTLVLCRTGIGALLLLPVAAARGQLAPVLRRWRPLVAFTVAELAIPWWLLSDAERRLPSSLSGLLVAAIPLVGALLALSTAGGERLAGSQFAGLALGLGGVAVLAGLDVPGSGLPAVGEVALVVVGYALGPAILAHRLSDLPGLGVVAASLALCTLAYVPAGVLQAPRHFPPGRQSLAVVVLGVVCTAVAFLVFFALIGEVGPVRATVITYVNPVVAVALGVVFLRERAGAGTVAGAVLIFAGSLLATGRVGRPVTRPAPG
jgi:drug/metabolite transporter (DMT)-like permease